MRSAVAFIWIAMMMAMVLVVAVVPARSDAPRHSAVIAAGFH